MFTKEHLVSIGAEKLADIILSLYKENPDIQSQLEMSIASCNSDPESIITVIKEEIKCLRGSHLDYYEDYRHDSHKLKVFLSQLHQVYQHISKDVLPNFPGQAIELLLNFLELPKVMVVNGDFELEDVFYNAYDDLCEACKHSNNAVGDVVDLVYKLFMNNDYCIYDDIISRFKDILGDDGLSLLTQKFEKSQCKHQYLVKNGLMEIADLQNDVDAFIKACSSKEKPSACEHLKIAERLIKHGRCSEAIQWLDSAALSSWEADKKRTLKLQALDLCGDHKAAQAERLNWFVTTLSDTAYNEVLKNSEADFIESFKKTAIEKALDFPEVYVAFTFLLKINDLEQVGKLVKLKINSLDGSKYYTLRPIAEVLHEVDPLAATLLHRKLMEPVLDGGKTRYYHWAAKDLATCHGLSSKITDWQTYQNHQQYFKKISVEHKQKTSFWQEYDAALNKQTAKKAKLAID